MCLGTCLALFAAQPRGTGNAQVINNKPSMTMAEKGNTFSEQLTQPVMAESMKAITPQQYFTSTGLTPNDNRLTKRAPRRVNADDVMATKIAFMQRYEYIKDNNEVVPCSALNYGGWDAEMEQWSDNEFGVYMLYQSIPFTIIVDYANSSAEMEMGYLAGWQWSDTVINAATTIISDTTEYLFVLDEAYLVDGSAEDITNLTGTLYSDGTLYFPDGWCVFLIDYVTTKTTQRQTTTVTYDTIWSVGDIYRNTYLMTANATHDYEYNGSHYQNNAYMFQYDGATAVAWNLYGLGYRGNYMNINADGSLVFPAMQCGGDMTSVREWLEENYPQYDWSSADHMYLMAYDDSTGYAAQDVDITGTATHDALSWDATAFTWWGSYTYDDGSSVQSIDEPLVAKAKAVGKKTQREVWNYMIDAPYTNNVLAFTDGEKFIFDTVAAPEIIVAEGDQAYTFTGSCEENGATVDFATFDPESGQITAFVDNPYVVQRSYKDQIVYLAAISRGYAVYKNDSQWIVNAFNVPAMEQSDDAFAIHHAEVLHGDTVIIPVSLTNGDEVTAFQTDLYLPEGFVLSGEVTLSDRKADHVFNTRVMPDGAIRILCYSTTLQPLAGNEGELFYLTVSTPQESAGDYTLTLKKSLLTTTNYEELNCGISTGTLTVLPYLKGDANDSRSVNVADIVTTAMYILGEDPNPFVFGAADMNEDGEITVTDIVLIAHMILYPDGNHASLLRAPIVGNSHNAMSGVASYLADNQRRVSIILEGQTDLTAFQLDLTLPAGMTASNFCLTDRSGNHDLQVNTLDNGKTRVMCFSPQLEGIEGNQGTLLTFDVNIDGSATGDILVDGIETVTTDCLTTNPDGFTIQMNGNGSTSVQEINNESRIYAEGNDIVIETPVEGTALVSDAMGRARRVNLQAGRNVIPAGASGIHIVRVGDKTAKLMLR